MQTPVLLLLSVFVWLLTSLASAAEDPPTNSVVLAEGTDWVPLRPALEIEPGSALDFSTIMALDAPAGKHGRLLARRDGQFAFVDSPKKARRFYGVNFCFTSLYLSHEQADRVAERLARLGYNALRIHHYESELTRGQLNSWTLNPEKLEQFDYFMAALVRRGIYLTTDLFVSRGIPYRELNIFRNGQVPMDTFKAMVPVNSAAFENWKKFARAFLDHTNPYTHHRYADEPALAWLAMINEGNLGNFFKDFPNIPEWKTAWNHWLGKRYTSRLGLAEAWGTELKENEDPAQQTVEFPERLQAPGPRARDFIVFLADTERNMVERMRTFLRQDLGCRALISNSSSWTRFITDQGARTVYDYVDDHFYVDHPRFLESPWRLPSSCPNTSPLAEGAPGGRSLSFTRLFDKPFTVTEYNYSGPGRFRGVGGILTGALGALQGWGGIWRFAYSHSRESLFTPARMDYFNLDCDPLAQASDRASLCLFLRGDLQTAPHSVGLVMTTADLEKPADKIPTLAPNWHWLAWVTRLGTQVVPSPTQTLHQTALVPLAWRTPAAAYPVKQTVAVDPYKVENQTLLAALRDRGIFSAKDAPDPARKVFRSETGEITIDASRGCLVLDTPRTAGGYAPVGQTIEAEQGGLKVAIEGSDATVWVSALDQNPIRSSRRLLVTHLTDLQNTNIRYGEPERRTLVDWGELPYLVHTGRAQVTLQIHSPKRFHVWALSPSGKRLEEVPFKTRLGSLSFTADVAGKPSSGARMLYELAAQ